MNSKKYLTYPLIMFLVFLMNIEFINASAGDIQLEKQTALIVRKLPDDPSAREKILIENLSEPEVCFFDLSEPNITDNDVKNIFIGFAIRQTKSPKSSIKFVDISRTSISKEGVEALLGFLEDGLTEQKIEPKISQQIMRETIMKVPSDVQYTKQMLTDWQDISPFVFRNGLRILG